MDPEQLAQLENRATEYREGTTRHNRAAVELDAQGQRIGNYRGVSFLLAVLCVGAYLSLGHAWLLLLGALSCFTFIGLVKRHSSVVEQEETQRRYALVNEHALSRITQKWHGLPRSGSAFAPENHPYAGDLDLFGTGSLYQRLSVAHTRYGQATLVKWLSEPAQPAEIGLRQAAVTELSSARSFRHALEASGMALVDKGRSSGSRTLSDGPNPSRLIAWTKTREPLLEHVAVLALSYLLPACTLGAMLGQALLGWPPYYWFGSIAASLLLLMVTKHATSEAFAAVSTTEGAFLRYGDLLQLLETYDGKAAWFAQRRATLVGNANKKPSAIMGRFRNIVSWYDFRHNGMAYPFFNPVLLWDIHCSAALHRWKSRSGVDLERWFATIGEYEAISSLAGLLADDPAATLPVILSGQDPRTITAQRMGHPLLSAQKRVCNDLEALNTGQALLVTGSNMSGKSTFLRALGVNSVLAFAGGPVIAQHMSLPPLRLGTSIRVADSLSHGVSHFYAEVQKLAHVVDLARNAGDPVLFLLDEVLHGTNSRERQVGARWVLAELLKLGAFGVITTHDMELCRLPDELMTHVRQHHFRELVVDGEMTFDYTLRQGPVTSGNALRLMRKVGLDVPLDG